mmetsp:Transcript_50170/g.167624  ORF Transcript_50170/g.167624 Transcript_50170/m.167624 type:complete len:303 (-) Transcript_50170:922-1830(-)
MQLPFLAFLHAASRRRLARWLRLLVLPVVTVTCRNLVCSGHSRRASARSGRKEPAEAGAPQLAPGASKRRSPHGTGTAAAPTARSEAAPPCMRGRRPARGLVQPQRLAEAVRADGSLARQQRLEGAKKPAPLVLVERGGLQVAAGQQPLDQADVQVWRHEGEGGHQLKRLLDLGGGDGRLDQRRLLLVRREVCLDSRGRQAARRLGKDRRRVGRRAAAAATALAVHALLVAASPRKEAAAERQDAASTALTLAVRWRRRQRHSSIRISPRHMQRSGRLTAAKHAAAAVAVGRGLVGRFAYAV